MSFLQCGDLTERERRQSLPNTIETPNCDTCTKAGNKWCIVGEGKEKRKRCVPETVGAAVCKGGTLYSECAELSGADLEYTPTPEDCQKVKGTAEDPANISGCILILCYL